MQQTSAGSALRHIGAIVCVLVGLTLLPVAIARADVTYLYDDVGRLVRVIRADGEAATYVYDVVGNLLSIARASGVPPSTTVTTVSTDTLIRGETVTVTIGGFNLLGAQVTPSSGLTITSMQATVDGLVVHLAIAPGASLGAASLGVSTLYGSAQVPFTVKNAVSITSIFPPTAVPGMVVTVTGSPFDAGQPANHSVRLNGVTATVLEATATSLKIRVPAGATTGAVSVTTPTATGVSSSSLTVRTLGAARASVPTTDLLAYWTLDVDGRDDAGPYDLTLQGGLEAGAVGMLGLGLDFQNDAALTAIRPGNDAAFNFGGSDFSVALWARWNATGGEQVLLDKCEGGCAWVGWTLTKLTNNALLLHPLVGSAPLTLNPGQWYHVAVVREGSTARMYLDGTQIASAGGVGTIGATSTPFLMGRRSGSQNLPTNGVIDEVGVWSRALTGTEVATLATAPPPGASMLGSFTPRSAVPGMAVTVQAGGLDQATPSNNTVRVNGVTASILALTPTSVKIRVPAGATAGPISVTAPSGNATSAGTLAVHTLGPARTSVPTTDLLAYWGFDFDGRDDAGSFDLTLQGGLSSSASGILGSALAFPSDPARIAARLRDDAALNFGSSDFSFAVWAKWTSLAGEQVLLDKCDAGCGAGGWTFTKLSSNAFLLHPLIQSAPQTLVTGQWYHLAVVREDSTARMYLDGVEIAQATGLGSIATAASPFWIGERSGGQTFPMNGTVDEVGLWTRALTPSEVATLASSPSPTIPIVSGFAPSRALAGMHVTVQGAGFDAGTPANNVARVNGTDAEVLSVNSTTLTLRVPATATTGPISVTRAGNTGTSGTDLTVQTLGAGREQVPTTDLLAYWGFDLDGRDDAGSLDLTLQGGLSTGSSGIIGPALTFNGDPARIAVRPIDDAALNFGAADFSFALWAKWTSLAGEQVLLDKCDAGCGAGGWTFTKLNGSHALLMHPLVQSGANALVAEQWYHLAVVREGSTARMYLDGVQVAQATGVGAIGTAASPFWIGERSGGQTLPMNGVVDEVGLWQRALTSTEVAALAAGPPPGPPVIASFTPARALPGMVVTVNGTGFDEVTPANNVAKVNGTVAQILSVTASTLRLRVPGTATTGPVSVTTPDGTGTSGSTLTIGSLGSERTHVPTDDLAAYWTLDVNGLDAAGDRDLTLQGGLTNVEDSILGGSVVFPGDPLKIATRPRATPF